MLTSAKMYQDDENVTGRVHPIDRDVQFRSGRYGQALAETKVVDSVASKDDSPTTRQLDIH